MKIINFAKIVTLQNKSLIRSVGPHREQRSIDGLRSSGGTLMHDLSYSLSTGSRDSSMLWMVDVGHVTSTFT